jgi:RHS repeat-associated protein
MMVLNDSDQPTVIQSTDFYPFGMSHQQPLAGTLPNKYLYNGMEYQTEAGLDVYSAGFRTYDPSLGRWWQQDPLQDALPGQSAYHQAFNNPIAFADPLGLWPEPGLNRNIGESAGEQWMRQHGLSGGYTNPVFTQMAPSNQFSNTLNSFTGSLPFGTNAKLTPTGNGRFDYTLWEGMAFYSNFGNMMGSFWLAGYGDLRLTNPSYQYGNTFAERATNLSFWGDMLSGTDDPNTIQMDISDNPVSWLISGAGVLLAAAKGLNAARGINFGQKLFLSERFGITSMRFNSSATHAQGTLNQGGRLFKAGWSTGTNAAGQWGYKFRIGIGSSSANPNIARFHRYVPGSFVPNSFANPSIQVKRSLFNLGLKP